MSDEAQRFLEALHDYLVPVIGPAATGVVGFMVGKRKDRAEANKIDAEADVLAIDSVTASFKTLIDGYERRIEDLTAEVTELREEIKELRKALDVRPRPYPPPG
jgi:predicted RNase H-like nuclease (RuvC/YqgF family)